MEPVKSGDLKKPLVYFARRIKNGVIVGTCQFNASDSLDAFSKAHAGIDILAGEWVEVELIKEDSNV